MFIHRHHAHIYRQSDANYKIAIRNNELVYCFLNADQCVFICQKQTIGKRRSGKKIKQFSTLIMSEKT